MKAAPNSDDLPSISVADGAAHGDVPSYPVPPGFAGSNKAYDAVRAQADCNEPVTYGTSYFCCPNILDEPLNLLQVLCNTPCPTRGPSFCCCAAKYRDACAGCCTSGCVGCTRCLLKLQGYEQTEVHFFETHEEALAALTALPANPAVPEEIAGFWYAGLSERPTHIAARLVSDKCR